MKKQVAGTWIVVNIGCIECDVLSDVVGVFDSKQLALAVADECYKTLHWRQGGQNDFEVFDLSKPTADEYLDAIAKAKGES